MRAEFAAGEQAAALIGVVVGDVVGTDRQVIAGLQRTLVDKGTGGGQAQVAIGGDLVGCRGGEIVLQGHAGITAGQYLTIAHQTIGSEPQILPGGNDTLGVGQLCGTERRIFAGLNAAMGVVESAGNGQRQTGQCRGATRSQYRSALIVETSRVQGQVTVGANAAGGIVECLGHGKRSGLAAGLTDLSAAIAEVCGLQRHLLPTDEASVIGNVSGAQIKQSVAANLATGVIQYAATGDDQAAGAGMKQVSGSIVE